MWGLKESVLLLRKGKEENGREWLGKKVGGWLRRQGKLLSYEKRLGIYGDGKEGNNKKRKEEGNT